MALFLFVFDMRVLAERRGAAQAHAQSAFADLRSQPQESSVPEDMKSNKLWKETATFVEVVKGLRESSDSLHTSISKDLGERANLQSQLDSLQTAVADAYAQKENLDNRLHTVNQGIKTITKSFTNSLSTMKKVLMPDNS
eukprot:CAMPEP_0172868848 /NCGR_PEP_ID=MMETSP1075-20121228/87440_1 /TAXON_ID=2916 /ORGANISM="Ceratium fusus, Strain PA161109" /LENGTH=139 /DNA_ID=CAMNT_0013718589 /DNA_START=120 /DNA_END=539 /DNA_ORIENTATION=+